LPWLGFWVKNNLNYGCLLTICVPWSWLNCPFNIPIGNLIYDFYNKSVIALIC
jgi:hypothetical protein